MDLKAKDVVEELKKFFIKRPYETIHEQLIARDHTDANWYDDTYEIVCTPGYLDICELELLAQFERIRALHNVPLLISTETNYKGSIETFTITQYEDIYSELPTDY